MHRLPCSLAQARLPVSTRRGELLKAPDRADEWGEELTEIGKWQRTNVTHPDLTQSVREDRESSLASSFASLVCTADCCYRHSGLQSAISADALMICMLCTPPEQGPIYIQGAGGVLLVLGFVNYFGLSNANGLSQAMWTSRCAAQCVVME